VNPQCLGQRIVNEGIVVPKLLPQRLLGLGLIKISRRHADAARLLLPGCDGNVRDRRGDVRRRGLDAVCWALRHHASVLLHHQHL
jgi:hypothetical protein